MAPEIFKGMYNEKVDVFALAVILHQMLLGFLPDVMA
jgi:serine/threonine protein kinase